jgi:hypothetical protein
LQLETLGRFTAFKANLKRIEERNRKGQEKHGVTKFCDLTPEEFKSKYLGLLPTKHALPKKLVATNSSARASSINWNERGALTPIKNQGKCGSCWAFSATEQLESDYYLSYNTLKVLSPQQITSCTTTCNGCNGGNPINAWDYVNSYGGQELNANYPYVSGTTEQTGTCDASSEGPKAEDVSSTIGYMISDSPSDESNMLAQMESSPMSVTVDAELWQTYESGIITSSSGCGTTIDHAVQATGFSASGNYWIVRNRCAASRAQAASLRGAGEGGTGR